MTALSPAMTPVSFKCACFDSNEKMEINEKVLQQVLKHDNREWNNELLALEMNITVRQSRQSGVARATCPD